MKGIEFIFQKRDKLTWLEREEREVHRDVDSGKEKNNTLFLKNGNAKIGNKCEGVNFLDLSTYLGCTGQTKLSPALFFFF